MIANGWQLFYFKLFKAALDELERVVTKLAAEDPRGYKSHPKTKLLASVYRAVTRTVPDNPAHPDFRLGKTLGAEHANWRRVKKGMPDRYRLFFRFSSTARVIVLAWVNDEQTKRAYGSRTDAYTVFAKMLKSGNPPDDWDALLASARAPSAARRLAGAKRNP